MERIRQAIAKANPELIGGVVFGILILLALPGRVVVIDDDFGYLRSIVESWQRGRIWTDEFLVPFSATTTGLSCLILKLTGSMRGAVHGSLALTAGILFAAFAASQRLAGISRPVAMTTSLLILGGPTVVFMLLMFTSVSLHWAALWVAVWAALKNRWGIFAVALLAGIANRQSALVWISLPGWVVISDCWRAYRSGRGFQVNWPPFFAVMLGLAAFVILKLYMNETAAQQVASEAMRSLPGAGPKSVIGLLSVMGGFGWASLARCLGSATPIARACLVLAPFGAILGGYIAVWAFANLSWSHSSFTDPWAQTFIALTGAVGGFGLFLSPRVPWGPAMWTAVGACLPQLIYASGFDYYYLNTFFWGFAAALGSQRLIGVRASVPITPSRLSMAAATGVRWIVLPVTLALLTWNGRCYLRHKLEQDRAAVFTKLYEEALRSGKLKPHEIGFVGFGYLGWRLDRHFLECHGPTPGGFMAYQDDWDGNHGTGTITSYPKWFKRHKPWLPTHNQAAMRDHPDAVVVAHSTGRVLWFWKGHFEIRRVPRDAPRPDRLPIDYDRYVDHPFPVSDAEWRLLLAGDRTLGLGKKAKTDD